MPVVIASPLQQKHESIETSITLKGIRWTNYQTILDDAGEERQWRIAYDQGNLEIRMPKFEHEVPNHFLSSLIEAIADELELEILNAGSLGMRGKIKYQSKRENRNIPFGQ